ncbi:MAG TPA: mycothiol synthase [Cryptosporangiaceae bacterium]|nr:mycothiol synthase [Cryptosporangiaceae bacterium]
MTTAPAADIETVPHLTPDQVRAVLRLMDEVGDADGTYPLSEHVVLHLRHGGDTGAKHLLVYAEGSRNDSDDALAGYGHLDVADVVEGASAELAVHPAHRRQGYGRALVEAAVAASPDGRLRLWAHGEHDAAAPLAKALGFRRSRVLWQMRRSLYAPVPAPELPDGVRLRPFEVGRDEDAWVRVNNRAFADHPDQGRWTRLDLEIREAEPWFDPAGFLLAEREDGALLGFHWTKVHGATAGAHVTGTADATDATHDHDGVQAHPHEPIGEVYVLGVDPAAQGMRLGAALTLAGLRYLRGRGLSQAMLYVDESNVRAVALYERLGFVHWSTDVAFLRN